MCREQVEAVMSVALDGASRRYLTRETPFTDAIDDAINGEGIGPSLAHKRCCLDCMYESHGPVTICILIAAMRCLQVERQRPTGLCPSRAWTRCGVNKFVGS